MISLTLGLYCSHIPDGKPPQRARHTLSSSNVRLRSRSLSQYWANFLAQRRGFSLRRRNWRRGRASRSLSHPSESTSSWLKCHCSTTSGLEDSAASAEALSREEEDDEGATEGGGFEVGEGALEGSVFESLMERSGTKTQEMRHFAGVKDATSFRFFF